MFFLFVFCSVCFYYTHIAVKVNSSVIKNIAQKNAADFMQIDGMDMSIKIPASYDSQPGKLSPHIIVFLVNDGRFQIAAIDVSNHFTITEEITTCNVDVVVIDAVAFRSAVFVEHPACEVTGLSHIFHCSEPSFSLICIYRIHQNAAFVY